MGDIQDARDTLVTQIGDLGAQVHGIVRDARLAQEQLAIACCMIDTIAASAIHMCDQAGHRHEDYGGTAAAERVIRLGAFVAIEHARLATACNRSECKNNRTCMIPGNCNVAETHLPPAPSPVPKKGG